MFNTQHPHVSCSPNLLHFRFTCSWSVTLYPPGAVPFAPLQQHCLPAMLHVNSSNAHMQSSSQSGWTVISPAWTAQLASEHSASTGRAQQQPESALLAGGTTSGCQGTGAVSDLCSTLLLAAVACKCLESLLRPQPIGLLGAAVSAPATSVVVGHQAHDLQMAAESQLPAGDACYLQKALLHGTVDAICCAAYHSFRKVLCGSLATEQQTGPRVVALLNLMGLTFVKKCRYSVLAKRYPSAHQG